MAYHNDLMSQAFGLLDRNPPNPTQADLRRAVSTAYYALFHLLVSETIANWSLDSSRQALGRMFEHTQMKKASKKILDSNLFPFIGEEPAVVGHLKVVATSFVELQDKRHIADYDNSTQWGPTQALDEVLKAANALYLWELIKDKKVAQDFLVSLLIRTRD